MSSPKISIVTVVYNAEATIIDCVESVLNQDYDSIEYIIIDGGSTDNTLSLLSKYSDNSIKLISEPDEGIYDAMNKGIQRATGDVVGILNSDDRYEHNQVLAYVAQQFLQNPIDALCTSVAIVKNTETDKIWRYYNAKDFSLWQFRIGMQPPHPGFFLRNDLYNQYGLYDKSFRISGDFELLLRMLYVYQIKTLFSSYVSVRMRDGGVSNSSFHNKCVMNLENHLALKKNKLFSFKLLIWLKYIFKVFQLFKKPKQPAN